MLAEGRTSAEVERIAALVFGDAGSILERSNNYQQALVVLKKIPGPWDKDGTAEKVRAAARLVVGGAK